MAAESDRAGRLFAKAPAIRSLIEMAQHLADAKAALDLELAVEVAIGCRDRLLRNVRSKDFDRPALRPLGRLGNLDVERTHFLPGGTFWDPDTNVVSSRPYMEQN